MKRLSALSLVFSLISLPALNASAQCHPGSVEYNTVVVPGELSWEVWYWLNE